MAEQRLIDANVFNSFDYSAFDGQLSEDAVQGMDAVLNLIDKAPTVDAVPVVHGRWTYDHWCEFKCSCCGHFSSTTPRGKEKYCPNCGAKMEGGAP